MANAAGLPLHKWLNFVYDITDRGTVRAIGRQLADIACFLGRPQPGWRVVVGSVVDEDTVLLTLRNQLELDIAQAPFPIDLLQVVRWG